MGCKGTDTISKDMVLSMFLDDTPTKTWLNGLDDTQWEITNFNRTTGELCLEVDSGHGTRPVVLTMPEWSPSSQTG